MEIVILTALGVGGSTLLGALFGLLFRKTKGSFNDLSLAFAAGIMLAAAIIGLILPSTEYGGKFGVVTTILGIFIGALFLFIFDLLLRRATNKGDLLADNQSDNRCRRAMLFVFAIALHNLPEGIAAGVGFGGEDISDGIFIAAAIALQNIPEGMAVIIALLGAGEKTLRTLWLAAFTGIIEVVGTFIGYFAVGLSSSVLPFALAFAGGNMLYVIEGEMIVEAHSKEGARPSFLFLGGFCLMLVLNEFL